MAKFGGIRGGLRTGALVLLALLGTVGSAGAQSRANDRIAEIRIDGVHRVEAETVRTYLRLRAGDEFSASGLDRSLKDLYATGLFADVTLAREGDVLVVRVVENPIINRLAFEGNKRIKDEDLEKEVQLRPRIVFTRTRVQQDVQRLLEVYRRRGRFAASVTPKVIQLPQNRVDLVFEINEGAVTKISSINFIGNRRFSDSKLREIVRTRESAWYRIFSSDDNYDPDRLTFDRELLRRFYLNEGYADFRVVSAVAELTPDREGFFITFTIEEGDRYRVGKVDVITRLPDLDVAPLTQHVIPREGEVYSADEVERTIDGLTDAVGVFGYAFVDIRPRVKRDREARTIDITFDIQEGPRVFVERIDIAGNVRTLDKVIRREFRLVEGDAFNTAKLRRSRERIRNLGFFEKAEVKNVAGSKEDRSVIEVSVEEKSTGEFSIGAGYSTTQGALATVGIVERNLLGQGQSLGANLSVSQRTQEIDLKFTEPYFLDRDLSAGVDLFRARTNQQAESSFSERRTGFNLRSGYQITEPLRHRVRYGFKATQIENVDSTASAFIKEQEGSSTSSLVGHELTYDRRDNRLTPTKGYVLGFGNDLAGLGGDVRYLRTEVSAGFYHSVVEDWVASLQGKLGYIAGLDDKVGIADRFFLGGDNLRGFEIAGVGPRDRDTGDSLGGNQYASGTAELSFPIGLPNEFGITGKFFSDFGTLTDLDSKGSSIVDTGSLRATIGMGLGWQSPFGPMRIDYAVPYLSESFDKKQAFRFSFGTRF